ncbi:MAG: beta-propeller fold lactonase family protein [Myxococcota bacterium]
MGRMLLFVAVLWACGDDDGMLDAGADGSRVDAGETMPDAGVDAGIDAGTDADFDAGTDAAVPARDRLMYVSVSEDRRIAVLTLRADGTMVAESDLDLDLPGRPGAMTYARSARRLYVGIGDSIGTIALDGSGAPSLLGRTEGTGRPVYLEVAYDDAVLVSAYFSDGRLRTHDVSGMPPHAETESLDVDNEAHAALLGPSGRRIYVPYRTPDVTQWFDLGSDGSLSFAGEVAALDGAGPRHIIFRPDGRFAWVINEFADSVTAYAVEDGALRALETTTTLPAGFDGGDNTCADIHVTPDGRFVYGSNRGHDSLAMFAVEDDGNLVSAGQIATEARPREFDLSPDGRFVVAAGQDSGQLQSYRVEDDGSLTSVARLEVGGDLRWVVID